MYTFHHQLGPIPQARPGTHHSLDHQGSLGSQLADKLVDVDRAHGSHSLHHAVQHDEGASPADSGAAVDEEWLLVCGWVELADTPDEVDEGHGIGGDPVVWPGQVGHLADLQGRHRGLLGLWGEGQRHRMSREHHTCRRAVWMQPTLTFVSTSSLISYSANGSTDLRRTETPPSGEMVSPTLSGQYCSHFL